MIRAWLNFSSFGIFLSLGALYFGTVIVLGALVFRTRLAAWFQTLSGIVAPFFNASAILFALLASFLANDVGDRSRQASHAVQAEAAELHNIYTLSVASASDMAEIRAALKVYAASVVADEWPAMSDGKMSARTSAAYDDLLSKVSDPLIAKESGAAVHAALLNVTVRMSTTRNERLTLASDHTNDLKWIVVIMLGLITQVSIALVHLERPRAFMTALTVYACAAVITLGFIALQEYPFYGAFQISPAPIQAFLALNGS